MKKGFIHLILIICIGLVTLCVEKEKGWKSLFDGNTFSGWIIDEEIDGKCYIDNNNIVGEITQTMYYLRSEKKYDNFILELEFKVDSGVNSGVQLRSDFLKEDKTFIYVAGGQDLKTSERTFKAGEFSGYQIEIETTPRAWSGGFYEQSGRGWLQPLNHNEPARKAFKQQDWNHLRIIADRDHFQSWLNGAKATDFYDSEATTGYIGFQFHNSKDKRIIGKKIRFRNIQIREL